MPSTLLARWVWRAARSWSRAGTRSGWKIQITTRELRLKSGVTWDFLLPALLCHWPVCPPVCSDRGIFFYLMRRNAHLSRRSIHPNLKSTVYCNAIAFGGVEEWDFAWRMFKSATLASEASRLRHAMACTKVPWLLNRCVSPFMVLLLSHHDIRVNGRTLVRWTWLVSAARECPNISQHLSQLAEANDIFLFLSFAIYSRQSYKHTSDNIQSVTEILRTCECVCVCGFERVHVFQWSW